MRTPTCIHGVPVYDSCDKCPNVVAVEQPQEPPTDNVRIFPGITPYSLDPDLMLNKAVGHLKSVVIVGYDKEGNLFFSSSEAAGPEVLWLLEKAKQALLEIGE